GDGAQRGGLAAAAGAEQAGDGAAADAKAQVVDDAQTAVLAGDLPQLENDVVVGVHQLSSIPAAGTPAAPSGHAAGSRLRPTPRSAGRTSPRQPLPRRDGPAASA